MAKSKSIAPEGIFTRADYDLLRGERRRLNDLIATFDKLGACGVDCATYKQMRDEIDSQLAAVETHFMTPPPGG